MRKAALAALLLGAPSLAAAWGERGHHAAAAAAARRVLLGVPDAERDSEPHRRLRDFFRSKAIELGHLSNIPDTAWRGGDPLVDALNKPTHFADADAWAKDFSSIPLSYEDALKALHGKPSLLDGKPIDLFETGTLYWRAQELYERTRDAFRRAATARKAAEARAALKDATLYAGLLAHFVADASMPLHNVTDWDSRETGNGGLHMYFETDAPLHAGPGLEAALDARVASAFGSLPDPAASPQPAALLARELGRRASSRLKELRRLDDSLLVERSGKSARRPHAEKGAEVYRPLLEDQLAEAAAALARLYRLAWEEGGRPDLPDRLWDYQFQPIFITPSYDPAAVERVKARVKAPR